MATDLQEQLQARFGNAYTLERELGGGAMSRVYLPVLHPRSHANRHTRCAATERKFWSDR